MVCPRRHRRALPDQVVAIAGPTASALIVTRGGLACRSADAGRTWTVAELDPGEAPAVTSALWTGSEFRAWGRGVSYRSAEGSSWTRESLAPATITPGAAAFDPINRVFVAVSGGWQQWYDQQEFYRSTDGVNWAVVEDGSFAGGHPIGHIAFGYAAPSDACPAPAD